MAQTANSKRKLEPAAPDLDRVWIEATVDGQRFVSQMNVLASITDQVRLCFGPEAITVETKNDSNTIAAEVEYTDVEYNASDLETTIEIAVSTGGLYGVLRSLNKHEGDLSMRLDADETHMVVSKGSYMDYVDIFDPESVELADTPDVDEMELESEVEMHTVDLKYIVGAVTGSESGAVVLHIDGRGGVGTYPNHPDEGGPNPFIECETHADSMTAFGCDLLWNVVGSLHPSGTVTLRNRDEWVLAIETDYAQYTIAPSLNVRLDDAE